ncbi:hypothetical protein ACMX25_12365 [Caballeronia sp. 15715]|uniref:hypothetical protein n=1 Tax=Caballeronia sp. 15715 TaxID=3391030 RepID=UPI0039E21A5B
MGVHDQSPTRGARIARWFAAAASLARMRQRDGEANGDSDGHLLDGERPDYFKETAKESKRAIKGIKRALLRQRLRGEWSDFRLSLHAATQTVLKALRKR